MPEALAPAQLGEDLVLIETVPTAGIVSSRPLGVGWFTSAAPTFVICVQEFIDLLRKQHRVEVVLTLCPKFVRLELDNRAGVGWASPTGNDTRARLSALPIQLERQLLKPPNASADAPTPGNIPVAALPGNPVTPVE